MDDELKKETQQIFYDEHHHIRKRWKARLVVCAIMLILAIISLILMDMHSTAVWFYSQILAVCYAVLSLWLFWYLNRGTHKMGVSTFWHQIFHWIGLLAALYLVYMFEREGILTAMASGVVTLSMLALTIYLIGIYSDITFVLIGIILAVFAYCLAYVQSYLYIIMIPVVIVAAIIIYSIAHFQRRRAEKSND